MPDNPTQSLDNVADHSSPLLVKWMGALAAAEVAGNIAGKQTALDEIAAVVSRAMARADLSGRKTAWARIKGLVGRKPTADPGVSLPSVSSIPKPSVDFTNIPDVVTKLYLEQHGPSIARTVDVKLTDRIRLAFASGVSESSDVLQDIAGYTRAYADTVYRTNLTTAYAAGQWQRALEPDALEISPAFEYAAVGGSGKSKGGTGFGDGDTRENHWAANGLLAGKADPIWSSYAPPMGYRCRCALRDVDRFELQDRGLLLPGGGVKRVIPSTFSKAHPDKGFGQGRPDQRVYSLIGS